MNRIRRVFGVTSLALVGFVFGCFAEDSGECGAGAPCPQRGEACDDASNTCEPQALDVDATGPEPAPASFTETLPFFRGTVCAATNIQPGDKIPVHIEMCVDPCINANGHKFKSQYKCNGTVCEAVLVVYLPDAVGTNCPADAFGKFPKANCQTVTIDASAGPLSTQSTGAITGTGTLELPFLTNSDVKEIADTNNFDAVWGVIYRYPQDAGRVFSLSMNINNPKAPADCKDKSKCTCKEIGF
ncbi:hypothetical protein [Nannocystis sp. SCPEA4]|uniref:hypothetical protein n=1 Tax=Nannocystis sp. SCPEA4 TaxID=2996787 RepID=UPI002270E460|nr:hypothetical protein [Nannocystis sp. SCPEA4]MCY1056904.1 hypothetical protein [Nannocystis sp. SCPEA4]